MPTQGFEALVLEPSLLSSLTDIVRFEKARKILYAHWGFQDKNQATIIIFHGPHGVSEKIRFSV